MGLEKGVFGTTNNLIDSATGLAYATGSGATNLLKGAGSGASNLLTGAGSGATNLLKGAGSGAADLLKGAGSGATSLLQTNPTNINNGGSASRNVQGTSGTMGQGGSQPMSGPTNPYTYNGALTEKPNSDFLPLTTDFSKFGR
jgi:hypothetical protein